jgi:hypothetical protein
MTSGLKLSARIALCCLAALAHAQPVPLAFSGSFNATANVGPNLGTLQVVDQSTIQGLGLGQMSGLQVRPHAMHATWEFPNFEV